MDYESFKNNLPFPRKHDFSMKYWYKAGKVVAKMDMGTVDGKPEILVAGISPADLKNCTSDQSIDESGFTAAKAAYYEELNRQSKRFTAAFYEELGIVGHPKAAMLYSKCYELGHSAGYPDIMNYGYDLVALIKD